MKHWYDMRADAIDTSEQWTAQGIVVSLLLHAIFFLLLLSIAPARTEDPPEEIPIEVDIVSFQALPPPSDEPQRSLFQPPAPPPPPEVHKPLDGMIRPGRILSADILAQPDNAEGRKDFSELTKEEQEDQICALEALEQIRSWNDTYEPQRMVSYTFTDVRYEGNRIVADGAVFWSHGNWHRLRFDCGLSADRTSVVSFAFEVGTIVPKDQWEDYYLTKYK